MPEPPGRGVVRHRRCGTRALGLSAGAPPRGPFVWEDPPPPTGGAPAVCVSVIIDGAAVFARRITAQGHGPWAWAPTIIYLHPNKRGRSLRSWRALSSWVRLNENVVWARVLLPPCPRSPNNTSTKI